MPTTVSISEEFEALEARVTALEQARAHPEPLPSTDPGEGVQAKRAAALVEMFGVNTFSSLDEHNVWGSWPADYRPDSVTNALKYITGNTRFCLRIREYHYRGREAFQTPWLQQIRAANPNTRVTLCVGANGSPDDVPSMLALLNDRSCGVEWVEGLNEPNTDFGSGEVPLPTTLAIQQATWAGASGNVRRASGASAVMGPSIVAGTPHPEGWIKGYCGGGLPALNAAMSIGNGHYYPPHCPDLTGDGSSLTEYVDGLSIAYNHHPIAVTEFHPTLYNSAGNKPGEPRWSGERDAYYTLLALLRAAKCGVVGLWWYALFDYGATHTCGLFPTNAENPRPAATALRNLCAICADNGQDMRTFAPGKLGVSVSGLPEHADWDLYQTSEGRFLLALWRAANNLETRAHTAAEVTVSFGHPVQTLTERDVITNEVIQSRNNTARLAVALTPSVRMLTIESIPRPAHHLDQPEQR